MNILFAKAAYLNVILTSSSVYTLMTKHFVNKNDQINKYIQSNPDYLGWSLARQFQNKIPVKTKGTEITVKKQKNNLVTYLIQLHSTSVFR